jgi:hypothetical protein
MTQKKTIKEITVQNGGRIIIAIRKKSWTNWTQKIPQAVGCK